MSVGPLLASLLNLYRWMIIAYVLLSWVRPSGFLYDVYHTLGTIVEPYLGIFRRVIPPLGMVDISPIVALIVLQLVQQFLVRLL